MAALTEEQKLNIKGWLSRAAPMGRMYQCNTCGDGKLMEPSVIVTLPGAEDQPMVPLTCNNCAQVTFLDLKRIES